MIGFLNLIKPGGITSHDLVNRVRRITGLKQVGHAGTLDPLATGVMVVGLSKACRLLQFLPDDKCYLAEILLGTRTDTDDIEGAVLEKVDLPELNSADLEGRLQKFVGKHIQPGRIVERYVPAQFVPSSLVHKHGKKPGK